MERLPRVTISFFFDSVSNIITCTSLSAPLRLQQKFTGLQVDVSEKLGMEKGDIG